MELDLTKLDKLAFMGFKEPQTVKQPSKTPVETLLKPDRYKPTLKRRKCNTGAYRGLTGYTSFTETSRH